jgi:hypothetical protein
LVKCQKSVGEKYQVNRDVQKVSSTNSGKVSTKCLFLKAYRKSIIHKLICVFLCSLVSKLHVSAGQPAGHPSPACHTAQLSQPTQPEQSSQADSQPARQTSQPTSPAQSCRKNAKAMAKDKRLRPSQPAQPSQPALPASQRSHPVSTAQPARPVSQPSQPSQVTPAPGAPESSRWVSSCELRRQTERNVGVLGP